MNAAAKGRSTGQRLYTRRLAGVWVAVSAAVTIPFFLCEVPPLNDYPSHLARAYIISALGSSANLQQYYSIEWQLVPNLGIDLLVPPIASISGVKLAGGIFAASALLLTMTGVAAIHGALFSRVSLAPIAVYLIAYNRSFLWGFVNYFFALGICFWLFAAWLHSAGWKSTVRIPVFSLASAGLFVLHLHALATYAVLVAAYELSRMLGSPNRRSEFTRFSAAALQFVPAILLLFFSPTADRAGEVEYGGLIAKITGIADAFHAYNVPLDFATLLLAAGALVFGLYLRIARLHSHMLLGIAILIVAYAVMPTTIFGSFAADRRLAASLWMIAAASIDWRFASARTAKLAGGLLVALILVRTAVVAQNWFHAGNVYQAYFEAFEQLPHGARVATAMAKSIRPFLENPPVMFIGSMAVVERDAFVNTLFAEHGHQPLRLNYLPADVQSRRLPHIFYVQQHGEGSSFHAGDPFERINPGEYDFVLLIHPGLFHANFPADLELFHEEKGQFALYRRTSAGEVPSPPSGQAWPR